MAKTSKETPLMKQYNQIKAKYPDALLLFRVGDFYETFKEDAVKTSQVLGIVLTSRNNGSEDTSLAGFPYHALNNYLPKLVKAGYRVAICDQLEDPKLTKTIVKRGVTELVTPGVALNDDLLQTKKNNFLASIWLGSPLSGVSFLDISTGEYYLAEGDLPCIEKLLQNFQPNEVLISKKQRQEIEEAFGSSWHYFGLEDWVYKEDFAYQALTKQFQTNSLKGFAVEQMRHGWISAGAILHYLSETQHHQLQHITHIKRIVSDEYVWMDKFTIRNLELYGGGQADSVGLLEVIDKTLTPMGSRLLRRWLALPLTQLSQIQQRHQVVHTLVTHASLREQVSSHLQKVNDIERLLSKIATGKITPRELIYLKNALLAILPLKALPLPKEEEALRQLIERIEDLQSLCEKIACTLDEEAPVNILKGNTIREGFSAELDELRHLSHSGKEYLNQLLEREIAQTHISSLKIDSNNVFGYYFEVRNVHKDKVPAHWIRKQTLVNAERYISEELKEYEEKILHAQERISALEQEYFSTLVQEIITYIAPIQRTAVVIGEIDTLCGFATLAIERGYTLPQLDNSLTIELKEARHPVIEQQLPPTQPYIANDIYLDNESQQIMMITGPNMSGKSALLRQTALIVLLAQIGSFVPAQQAKIGIVDKIFTRVGASDNISQGESTFMVEMNEAALILNNLSQRSLILLDEIGRGTSTYDGISIAWAIAEYLHEHPTHAKTLFATHYHELNEMQNEFARIKNFSVSVKEVKGSILFLRKLVEGGSEHSFGIHVAKMAGMPTYVIEKAEKVLQKLEKTHQLEDHKEQLKNNKEGMQLSFFQLDDPLLESIKEQLIHTDIDNLTPIEALMKLNSIKKMLKK
ncbi:DNA mismatch repair protein MutS [Capnocytophaga sp. oral taxon 863 str. F0517]|uniref:DNA mismatch repair protein MutS n=1 Tax=Capnocytophaga sp. oral taxon 863 TaxID=1227265 RepID=UPI0003979AB7|nr:DNA mismatch repair protein MutS [Capnocytophaga sp. oral taxon 863]ERI61806.1 DNA mismatch repair protein MutS [Capnocytophaga sp. oral taxon 863 str. F0517]